ncbi:sister chromatid cohesion protein PDS5 homolog B-like isoform X2 [Conger conger]|uniref:sister chromatid cohesion protein PDS5 homolog B-like isoform X2 n=1 Tax=Conger conger TaxID=82655 RepID=UPI002A59CF79|nr:sister chromatid cohesion protein PDS5 homolog B-like isoform X2 [Conger conger]
MAHPRPRVPDGKVTYPPGVKEISDKVSKEEMVRRLKMVVKTFMDMDQDSEEEKELYLNLALHLASDFFLKHPDKDVRLLVACCLADIFRIYAPEAPYTSPDKLKDIFMFITRQLKGLEDTKSAQFNRYFYLLENIAWVKSYNICFELEDCNEIFTQLYRTLFQVINNGHNQKVHMHMVDLMSSIVCEGDTVSQELLDTVLVNLVPAHKNLNKQAYDLAKALLKRTAQAIEPYITNFFNQVLMLGKTSVSDLSEHVFDLILELYSIDSHLLLSVLPQLEFKLKSNDNEERLQVVKLLAKMFGAKDSELATQNKPLWQCFMGRFNDIHVPVRLECVKFASHCLMNHPDLAKDLTEFLKVRSHDSEEAIRHDVIVSIVTAAKKDLSLVNDQLLNFVRERTLDKRWRVRKEAMMGLAQVYKKYSLQAAGGKEASQQISWIKDKLLHIYYQTSIDDRLLVERIFAQYMVPHNLNTTDRMKCLYYLYATLDPNAVKALNEMWKCQNMLRHHMKDLLELVSQPKTEASSKAVFSKAMLITRNLPDPGKAQDFVKKLAQILEEDERVRQQLDTLVSPACSCKQAEDCVKDITKKLSSPKQPSNPFLEMIKFLLERIAPVHIDTESISALIKQVNKSIDGTADDEDEGVPTDQAIRAGLELLKVLSFTHPMSFHSAETFESLLGCLKMEDEKVAEAALQIFKNTGHKMEESFPHIKSVLLPVLQHKAKKGPPRQAKYAVHCIHAMFSNRDTQFAQIFEPLHKGLDPACPEKLITPFTTLGHLALLAPEQFAGPLKSLVANVIVKDLLMTDRVPGKKTTKLWVPDDEVSPETLAKIQGIKLMVRWLLGLKNNLSKSGNSTLRLLSAILSSDGDLTEQGKMGKPDMSRLRLAAGSALLKLAQEPCYHDIITLEQYQTCALVINDECYQVRQGFAQKLNQGLWGLKLPLEYLAVFALCAKDPVKERRAHARQSLAKNVNIRREYLRQHSAVSEKLFSLLPEYVVPYAIHLLAHDPDYVKVQDVEQLTDIKESLWLILEIVMAKNENNSHAFIRKMVENVKQTRDAQAPGDPKTNEKLYTVCDIAMNLVVTKSVTYSLESPKDPVLPARFFTQPDKSFNNTKNYLPPEMKSLFVPGKPKSSNVLGAVNKPLSSAGKQQQQARLSRIETASNASGSSNPDSPGRSKGRLDSADIDHSENEDLAGLKRSDKRDDSEPARDSDRPRGRKRAAAPSQDDDSAQDAKPKRGRKKAAVATVTDPADVSMETVEEDEQNSPPKKGRRGRPPKSATPKEGGPGKGGRGRKKAPPPEEEEEKEGEEEEQDEEGDGNSETMEVKPKVGRQARTPRRPQKRGGTSETDSPATATTTPPKRRGRPPKSAQQPAKKPARRGRPRAGVKQNRESEDEEEEEEDEEQEV